MSKSRQPKSNRQHRVWVQVVPLRGGVQTKISLSRPPKDEPWYHVLVDQAVHTTYVAEQNLAPADEPQPIRLPLAAHYFHEFDGERYILRRRLN